MEYWGSARSRRSAKGTTIASPLKRLLLAFHGLLARLERIAEREARPRFATPARGLELQSPHEVTNPERMRVGDDVKLGPGSVLKCTTRYPGSWMSHPEGDHVAQTFEPTLVIGDRVTATGSLQIVVFERIEIEDDVLFASNIYISDGMHATTSADVPYKYQGIAGVAPIRIGRGAWIGQNAVILPGVTIGENAVVGANSVVTEDVPERCIAVGAPARVVRSWEATEGAWRAAP